MNDEVKLPETITGLPGKHPANAKITAPDGGIFIEVTCTNCGERFRRKVTIQEALMALETYRHGGFHPSGHVQNLFAAWSADDRELFLMSHLCGGCWKRIMGSGEGDE